MVTLHFATKVALEGARKIALKLSVFMLTTGKTQRRGKFSHASIEKKKRKNNLNGMQ